LCIFSEDIYGIKNLLDLEGIIYWSRKKKVKKKLVISENNVLCVFGEYI
jgi:hypothetical protein